MGSPPCGSAPAVGVAGYLLGGGLGPLARSYGFSADHIEKVEVVTPADGRLTVTAESAPDLFGRCAAARAVSASSPR